MLGLLALLPLGVAGSDNEVRLDSFGLGLEQPDAVALDRAVREEAWPIVEAVLLKAAEMDAVSAPVLRALGIAHFQCGRYFQAAAALKRADRAEPLEPEARFLLVNTFLRLQRRHWARAELERLVREHPDHGPYRVALAEVHYHRQHFEQGASELKEAISRTGGSVEAFDLLGQCLEGLGRLGEASDAYRRAITLDKSSGVQSAWPHFHLGSLLHDQGDLETATKALQIAARIDPNHAAATLELGIVLRKAGELGRAANVLEAAGRLDPDNPTIPYTLAGVYRQLGQAERSVAALDLFRQISDPKSRNATRR